MEPDVGAIEWDGHKIIGVTIDRYCFMFEVEDFESLTLALYRAFMRHRGCWIRPANPDFEFRPELVMIARNRAMEIWRLNTVAYQESPSDTR